MSEPKGNFASCSSFQLAFQAEKLKNIFTTLLNDHTVESFVDIEAKENWSGSTEFPFNKLKPSVPPSYPEVTTTQADHLEDYSLNFIDPYSTINQGCGNHCQEHPR